jgi:hypothetical protein
MKVQLAFLIGLLTGVTLTLGPIVAVFITLGLAKRLEDVEDESPTTGSEIT